jgi:signal transduction histidine kinase
METRADLEEKFRGYIESAAHDLSAPLRKISVLLDRLFEKHGSELGSGAKEYSNRIFSSLHEMQSLLESLTDLARAGEPLGGVETCDLKQIVTTIANQLQQEANGSIRFEIQSLPVVQGAKFQYRQLFQNLLENAVKFNGASADATIHICGEMPTTDDLDGLPATKKYHRIVIADRGIGFDAEDAEKIFEPFVRLHPKSKFPGNGLGLAICKRVVLAHNGKIFAEPNGDHGSCFVLILPEIPNGIS